MKQHNYALKINWTRNIGSGTNSYKSYERSFEVSVDGKEIINGSSDSFFIGDKTKYNPEELLLASISSCHILWYLHLCAYDGIIVTSYIDNAEGIMVENDNGGGKFEQVILKPVISVTENSMIEKAIIQHAKANKTCFTANSVNFRISHQPVILTN